MIKNIIKCCSCFVDKAVWFVNYQHPTQLWRFDYVNCNRTQINDIIDDKFISESHRKVTKLEEGKTLTTNTMIVCCVRCFDFQLLHLSSNENMMTIFDNANCRHVTYDRFTYGDSYSGNFFMGNAQFVVQNYFLPREAREFLFKHGGSSTNNFVRCPQHKSCFTSLQKCRYRFFCSSCKRIFDNHFEKDLYVFSSS